MNEMLRVLNEGGIHSTAELARRLGLSEGMVAAMAEDLARHGYLAALDAGCASGCKGCVPAGACPPGPPRGTAPKATLFALTGRGRRAARFGQQTEN